MRKLSLAKMVGVVFMFCAILSPAQTFKTLLNFNVTNGANPYRMSFVQGTDGNLYGTTVYGGAFSCSPYPGCGTVFRISGGALKTLYSFCAKANCTDGENPWGGVVQASNGNFYGTTFNGGNTGYGTVFKITPAGALTTLYSFCSQTNCSDGAYPTAGLVQASNGNFYGTTCGTICGNLGNEHGTVFKITPGGMLTTLYSFCAQTSCTDGAYPKGGLVQASNGNLYGTTFGGGASGQGTFFKITPSGTLTTLHSFNPSTDGTFPYDGVIQASDGNFYGTASSGGANGVGTVFKVTAGGTLTTLHSFATTDGSLPFAELVQGTDGNFYGTTPRGAANGIGTVFKITPGGTLTTLHTFAGPDGSDPFGGLTQTTNGIFYGITYDGGTFGDGTVFSLSVGLGSFVETRPTSGKVGAAVIILGTNLNGATKVTFNGTNATFKVVSKSEIKTTVPTGATTGTVKVKTPRGTLKSNVVFRVTK